jgi:hypothetical protein
MVGLMAADRGRIYRRDELNLANSRRTLAQVSVVDAAMTRALLRWAIGWE